MVSKNSIPPDTTSWNGLILGVTDWGSINMICSDAGKMRVLVARYAQRNPVSRQVPTGYYPLPLPGNQRIVLVRVTVYLDNERK